MDIPADTCAPDLDGHLARLQSFSGGGILDGWGSISNPEVMLGVGEDANVGLCRRNFWGTHS